MTIEGHYRDDLTVIENFLAYFQYQTPQHTVLKNKNFHSLCFNDYRCQFKHYRCELSINSIKIEWNRLIRFSPYEKRDTCQRRDKRKRQKEKTKYRNERFVDMMLVLLDVDPRMSGFSNPMTKKICSPNLSIIKINCNPGPRGYPPTVLSRQNQNSFSFFDSSIINLISHLIIRTHPHFCIIRFLIGIIVFEFFSLNCKITP